MKLYKKDVNIKKNHYVISGGGFDPATDKGFISLDGYNSSDEEDDIIFLDIPIPIRFDDEWFEEFKNLNLKE